jgi:eukaryotic-like serine/threonine-protein kinase
VAKLCPICRRRYDNSARLCQADGAALVRIKDELEGRVIGARFKILARIGSGGMADVYKGVDLIDGAPRAIKILRADCSKKPELKIRFHREIRAARLVDHENVVRIHDFGLNEDGKPFLALEYIEGVGLAEEIAKGPMPLDGALKIVAEIARALAAAHAIGVIHRDIKPENVMLLGDLRAGAFKVKIFDFGLVQIAGEERLTEVGQVFGTPEYISPEQAVGGSASPASDQYALGVVFYEMLTGRPPFAGSPAQVLMAQFNGEVAPPSRAAPSRRLTAEVDAVALRMLSKKPEQRYADMAAVIAAMGALGRAPA